MKQQEQKFQQLQETGNVDKVKEMKEKILWKNTLQKAEGQKIKDDPTLLKKSIKRQVELKINLTSILKIIYYYLKGFAENL